MFFCAECGGSLCRCAQKIWENEAGLKCKIISVYYDFLTLRWWKVSRRMKNNWSTMLLSTRQNWRTRIRSLTIINFHTLDLSAIIDEPFTWNVWQFSWNFQRYDLLKAHAEEKLEEANKEIDNISRGQVRFRFDIMVKHFFPLIIGCRDCKTDSLAEEDRDEGYKFGENGKTNLSVSVHQRCCFRLIRRTERTRSWQLYVTTW